MDLNQQYLELERDNEKLHHTNNSLRNTTITFIVLFAICLVYLIVSEVSQPLFGKWPRIARENKEMSEKMDSLKFYRQLNDSLTASNDVLSEYSSASDGVFFEVQIGAFEHFNLDKYKEELARLKKENVDMLDKYTLGKFRRYPTAEAFKRDIEKMGITGAFIVGKINGQRVEISEAKKASKKR